MLVGGVPAKKGCCPVRLIFLWIAKSAQCALTLTTKIFSHGHDAQSVAPPNDSILPDWQLLYCIIPFSQDSDLPGMNNVLLAAQ
jgi:hypothetical protein